MSNDDDVLRLKHDATGAYNLDDEVE